MKQVVVGDIITKNLKSCFTATVIEITKAGIKCRANATALIPEHEFIWTEPYIKLANLTGGLN